jgi:hypothetical protein
MVVWDFPNPGGRLGVAVIAENAGDLDGQITRSPIVHPVLKRTCAVLS